MVRRFRSPLALAVPLLLACALCAQVQQLGNISGRIHATRGDLAAHPIMVELRLHGATLSSAYADERGYFGFGALRANEYHVVINDNGYAPVDERANVDPHSSTITFMNIALYPREDAAHDDSMKATAPGGNPDLVGAANYNQRFPKKALKEYEKGKESETRGEADKAIERYLAALKIAPDYYPAHNNLGTLYLGKSDFKAAEGQFREAVRLDQNEAQAYFNLCNVLTLTKRYAEAETTLAAGLQRRPDSAFGYFLQGSLRSQTGKLAEAESSLRTAVRLDPKMSQAQLQLVNLYLRQNRRADAIAELQGFVKDFPDTPAAPKAKQILEKLQSQP